MESLKPNTLNIVASLIFGKQLSGDQESAADLLQSVPDHQHMLLAKKLAAHQSAAGYKHEGGTFKGLLSCVLGVVLVATVTGTAMANPVPTDEPLMAPVPLERGDTPQMDEYDQDRVEFQIFCSDIAYEATPAQWYDLGCHLSGKQIMFRN